MYYRLLKDPANLTPHEEKHVPYIEAPDRVKKASISR